ncbi:hypothetical protein R1sor_000428 [Riccia sorocarpa]|uniref:Mediator of RNA polymerase II transcription subunit 4 n=1 Tax=Riccia sorocarpa TaxID=122646 RepID=A0ABD3GX94_9MARC
MSGGFVVSRGAGRALVGLCIALPAAALVVRFLSFDPAKPYQQNPNQAEILEPPHVPPPIPSRLTEQHRQSIDLKAYFVMVMKTGIGREFDMNFVGLLEIAMILIALSVIAVSGNRDVRFKQNLWTVCFDRHVISDHATWQLLSFWSRICHLGDHKHDMHCRVFLHNVAHSCSFSIWLVLPTGCSKSPVLLNLLAHRLWKEIDFSYVWTEIQFHVLSSKDWQSGQSKLMIPPLLQGAVLPAEGAAATTSKEILGLLDYHQTLLFEAIAELGELQEMEVEKQRIAEAIASKDSAMRDFAKRVRDAQQVLEATLEEFDDYRRTKRKGVSEECNGVGLGTISVQDLVAYAHRISYTTFAPPEYAEGAPLRGALPPAPQDEQMRMSRLYQVNELDLGLPKPVEKVVSPVLAADGLLEAKPGFPPQAALPGGLPAPPAGWKPGMPLELPLELPPMPPGWKPGDPIPLPSDMPPLPPPGWKPGDAIVLPPAFAPLEGAAPAGPIKAPALPSAPAGPPSGVIHVPFVQLDLNPELEDEYGTEESEDDASSDDED